MNWRCSVCHEVIGVHDMVGYFEGENGVYLPRTLGFWHNNPACGRMNDKVQRMYPRDLHIEDFKRDMFLQIAEYIYRANTEEFRRDCAIFLQRCMTPGYEDAYTYFDEAISEGIIEQNTEPYLLNSHQIKAVLDWRQSY